MKLVIGSKKKAQIFAAIFQNLNKFTVDVNIILKEDEFYIQGMDSSHCAMFEIVLKKEWFEDYQNGIDTVIGVNSQILYKIFSTRQENQIVVLEYNQESGERLDICFKNLEKTENEFQKEFSVPLIEIDSELLAIPEIDYDICLNINSKSLSTIVSQLEIFDDVVTVDYNKENDSNVLSLKGNGDNGKIKIILKDDKVNNLNEFVVNNDVEMELSYSIKYISYFCSFSKVCQSVDLNLKESMPMVVHYKIEDSNNSYIKFYLAPKIND